MKYVYSAQCGYYIEGMGVVMGCKLYDHVFSKYFKLLRIVRKIILTLWLLIIYLFYIFQLLD
jgi:hypothetical protein